MSSTVKLNDIIDALDTAGDELQQYLDKRTGEIVLVTNEEMEEAEDASLGDEFGVEAEDEPILELPDWQREGIAKASEILNSDEHFVALPDQSDIHEYRIMEDFCLSYDNRRVGDELHRLIKGSGAFRRFKNAINSMGVEDAWYEFRRMEFERIAIEWLENEGILYTREDATEVSGETM